MSLVAYGGSSDEEEDIHEQEDGGGKVELVSNVQNGQQTIFYEIMPQHALLGNSVTFSKLPQPKETVDIIEEVQDEFLKKKEHPTEIPNKQSIRISVPSLAQFDSDDEDDGVKEKTQKVVKESGLFALLPPPKGTPLSNKSFIPNVLTRKPQVPVEKKKSVQSKPVRVVKNVDSGESDDEDILKDIPETFDEETWKKVCALNKKPQKRAIEKSKSVFAANGNGIEIAPETPKPYDGLNNEAFKHLVGSSKRRKENIKLIDINEEDVLPDKDLWLTKSLTDPSMVPQQEVEDPVNDTCRRKHHITYLAQQVVITVICIFLFVIFFRFF